jgi:hypothetical protein
MIPIQNGEYQSFDPTPPREYMCRGGRDETGDNGGDFQAP